jgi:hypothetical protein
VNAAALLIPWMLLAPAQAAPTRAPTAKSAPRKRAAKKVKPAPPPKEAPPKATAARPARGAKPAVIRLEEVAVEGRIAKPQAFYILQRSSLSFQELRGTEEVLPKIVRSVEQEPF